MLLDNGDGAKRDSEADKGMGDLCQVVRNSSCITWMKQRDVRAMMFGQWPQDGSPEMLIFLRTMSWKQQDATIRKNL